MLLQVQPDHRLDHAALVGIEGAAVDEVIGQRPVFLERPGLKPGDELDLVDQPILQRQQAEEQVAVRARVVHASSLRESRSEVRMRAERTDMSSPPRPDAKPARTSRIF